MDMQQLNEKIYQQISNGDYTGWFDTLYAGVNQNADLVPWSHAHVHPLFTEWLEKNPLDGNGKTALVLGSGLGDDAEYLAKLDFRVTAFDISSSAIAWSKERFPDTSVDYQVADLLDLPPSWRGKFDFVLEIFTVQSLPQSLRDDALTAIPPLLAEDGKLLFVCWGGDDGIERQGPPPWEVSRQELKILEREGLTLINAEDFIQGGHARRFRLVYGKR